MMRGRERKQGGDRGREVRMGWREREERSLAREWEKKRKKE